MYVCTNLQAPIPVMYPPQAAVVDPTWYYQQMMLYQMSPQSCIPRPQYAGVQQLVHPGAMFSRYAVAPGNTRKHTYMYMCICTCSFCSLSLRSWYFVRSEFVRDCEMKT